MSRHYHTFLFKESFNYFSTLKLRAPAYLVPSCPITHIHITNASRLDFITFLYVVCRCRCASVNGFIFAITRTVAGSFGVGQRFLVFYYSIAWFRFGCIGQSFSNDSSQIFRFAKAFLCTCERGMEKKKYDLTDFWILWRVILAQFEFLGYQRFLIELMEIPWWFD